MRLPLILVFVAEALAGGTFATRLDVYDDGDVTAFLPAVEGATTLGDTTLGARYGVDVVSGATPVLTVDTVSSATRFADARHQGTLSVEHRVAEGTGVSAFVEGSGERDWLGLAAGVGFERDLFDATATLGLAYTAGLDVLGSAADPTLSQLGGSHALDVEWRQILGRTTVARVFVSGGLERCGKAYGCRANPYRFVALTDDDDVMGAVHERNPDHLERLALALRISQAIGPTSGLHGGWRFYADSWGVIGHTLDVSWRQSVLEERLLLEGRARGSLGAPATFYRSSYAVDASALEVPAWRTADRELAGMRSLRVGGTAGWSWWGAGPFVRLGASVRVDRTWFAWPDDAGIPDRASWVVGGGFDAEL